MLANDLVAEGYSAQFVVLSDSNATDYVSRVSVPIFRDKSTNLDSWTEMAQTAAKHDTFVFAANGERTLYRRYTEGLPNWASDIRAAVTALGK